MADAVVQLVARLPSLSGLAEDTCENVINVGVDGTLGGGDVATAMAAFRDFYIVGTGQTTTVGARIGASISRAANACSILAYATTDLSGATPMGSPVGILSFTMPVQTGTGDQPEEVAVVCSYNADLTDVPVSQANPTPPPATIRPASRRRGRMYIGPLRQAAGATAGDGFFRPVAAFRTDIGVAFDRMATAINAVTALYLGIWSKVDEEVWQAVGGYVNDAWDTQRRRGLSPTTRTTFTI